MDDIDNVQNTCPMEIVEIGARSSSNIQRQPEIISDIMNQTVAMAQCQDSLLAYWFSLLDGRQDIDYVSHLINQAVSRRTVVSDQTASVIQSQLKFIPYQDSEDYASSYFALLTSYGIAPNEPIRNLPASEGGEVFGSPLWSKNLYLAYWGDEAAFEYLLKKMGDETEINTLFSMVQSAIVLKQPMKNRIVQAFSNDTRRRVGSDPNQPGIMLKDFVAMAMAPNAK